MDRRAFIGAVVGGVLAAPRASRAQARKMSRIGYLGTYAPGPHDAHWNAFVEGLRDHGYIEGETLQIERRFSEGQSERLPVLAAELTGSGVSVIVTSAPGPSKAVQQATTTIPVVFIGVADPVGFGLVASLARPGGNVTGLASIEWEAFQAKQLQVIKEALPRASRIAILVNPTARMHSMMLPQEQAAAARLGISLQLVEAQNVDELETAFAAAKRAQADLVHIYGDSLVFSHRARVAELALHHRLPTMHFFREAVEAGGLLSLGPDWPLLYRSAGKSVDKILKGTKPADIPVAQPTKYELVINVRTARALGLTIPPSLLVRADHIIE